MKITIFSEELRKCLNAAGLSDCGENDTWSYWYQRLMNAYNESVERQIMTEQDENAKLRELVALMYRDMQGVLDMSTDTVWVDDIGTLRDEMDCHMQAMAELGMPPADYERRMRELGVEVDA